MLKGSYAVYRKNIVAGSGTDKICHIYRQKIIDVGGRWVWDGLDVRGDRLLITISEDWLVYAKYPVVVDPVIGTDTVGTRSEWHNGDTELMRIMIEMCVPVNRFIAPDTFSGQCTAHYYCDYNEYDAWATRCCIPTITTSP